MGITNRAKDASEQKDVYTLTMGVGANGASAAPVNTGTTAWIGLMPYPGVLQSARSISMGLSGAPSVAFQILRFAAGGTTIAVSISSMILNEVGTSGVLGYSGLAAAGSTLLSIQAGDVLQIQTGVANTAARSLVIEVVVKKIQDIVAYNGVQT